MRRSFMLLSVVAVVLFGMMALAAQPRAIAQEASPAADEGAVDETFLPVTFALGVELPSPADIFVARINLAPGTGFPIESSDPSGGILLVDSGTFTVRVDVPINVTRGDTLLEQMMAAEASGDISGAAEPIPAGEEVVLNAGDAAYIPGNIGGEIRNDGEEPAVGLAFLASPAGGMMTEATPEP